MKIMNVSKVYHNKTNTVVALDHINLDLDHNGITMILGSSGCGKTTLMNCIAGMCQYEGKIEGVNHFDYLTQEFHLFEHMSVMNNLLVVSDDLDLIAYYLKEFELEDKKNSKVNKLSNGEKKRVQFIRALLHKSGLLLCDEPTAALDHENTELLMKMIQKISDTVQVIMVSHDIALANEYADRIIKLDQGRIVMDDVIQQRSLATPTVVEHKKSFKDTIQLVVHEIMSTTMDSIMSCLLVALTIITVFTIYNLNLNISEQANYQSCFKNARNMVVSLPHEMVKNQHQGISDYYMRYDQLELNDLFGFDQINEVIQNNPEIIGVDAWNSSQYPLLDYERKQFDCKAYEMFTLEGITGIDGNLLEQPDFVMEQPFLVKSDKELGTELDYLQDVGSGKEKEYWNYRVSVFDLVNEYNKLPILVGELPKNGEVLLSENVADLFLELEGYETYEDIIGKPMKLAVSTYKSLYYMQVEEFIPYAKTVTTTVSGVANVENDYTNMVFFQDGFGKNPLYQNLVKDEHSLMFHYVRFLLEPGSDYEVIAKQINDSMAKEHVDLVQFSGEGLGNKQEFYKSSVSFKSYGIGILVVLIVLNIVQMLYKKKRVVKEKKIMKMYGYSCMQESILRNFLIVLLALIISMIVVMPISNALNEFAKANAYQPFMIVNTMMITLIALIVWIVYVIVEKIFVG